MRFEIEAITSKARRSRRELRGVVVALMLLGCSTHLAFAHSTLSLPATPAPSPSPVDVVVVKAASAGLGDGFHRPFGKILQRFGGSAARAGDAE